MSLSHLFGNKVITEPGAYSTVKASVQNTTTTSDSGNVLIIDTGSAAGYGFGGIKGVAVNGSNAIQTFDSINDFQSWIGGGQWWKYSEFLLRPLGAGTSGVSSISFVSARETTHSKITLPFASGSLIIKGPEGLLANGVLDATNLVTGFGAIVSVSTDDVTKFVITIYKGVYTGADSKGYVWNGTSKANSRPIVVARSVELSNISEFITWSRINSDFKAYFEIDTASAMSGAIVAADIVVGGPVGSTYVLSVDATESYADTTLITQVLDSIADNEFNIIISDKTGADAYSSTNLKIMTELTDRQRHIKFFAVGAGTTKDDFATSLTVAKSYNNGQAWVLHGGCKAVDTYNANYSREYSVLGSLCLVIGRLGGLAPQTPLTFKALGMSAVTHVLTEKERSKAIKAGLLAVKFDTDIKRFVITWGLTSLQDNEGIVTPQGASREISIMRIAAQINRDVVVNSKIQLLANQSQGPNRNTLSANDVKDWVEGFLDSKIATSTTDNLLISYRDVTVSVRNDAYYIDYVLVPNWPVNFLFFTGTMVEN